ncbi:SIR2 family protein [Uliginosibacterium sp. TH139]|uniref:SIR2 family NAD-dependent protein deacylase n=1 Tax=Uliginosibacterium sp. TH139 TaxID=2067453 RepID=UPI000C7C21EC|nr:SIR2 family protein [Uliginosibacterium sp. TH139]PLK47007.1 SIR2 family protein [Uliginosibacterium sp. TH139]
MPARVINEIEFRQHVAQTGRQLMWFLGAGASRSSGLPTATDLTWDLKRRYYCAQENQDVVAHDVSNRFVQARIQAYMVSKGFPPLWDPTEYSFYFELLFGKDYAAQQRYLNEALATGKISSTIGHRALAALIHLGLSRIIFTTNFDEVVESAYASIAGKNLTTFHLEGSYAALEALNAESFPFYAKVHGDFRYQSVKNLSDDLLHNDREIQKCLVAAASRFGMIVSGYSGRDGNVMAMLREAIDQNNAFPHGLYWTVTQISRVEAPVRELMDYANSKGIEGGIVETGTFDEMLAKIWRLIAEKSPDVDAKVRSATTKQVKIPLPPVGNAYPMLRTNALRITGFPSACGTIDYDGAVDIGELKSVLFEKQPPCSVCHTDRILFWGDGKEIAKIYEPKRVKSITSFEIDDLVHAINASTYFKSMVEHTVATALVADKPLMLRKQNKTWYAITHHEQAHSDALKSMRDALSRKDFDGKLHNGVVNGRVPGLKDVYWAEAVSLKIEERDGQLWLLLQPDVWISPNKMREEATVFLRKKKIYRWNKQASNLLSAWIEVLLGGVGKGDASVTAYKDTEHSAQFQISMRSAFSRRSDKNV